MSNVNTSFQFDKTWLFDTLQRLAEGIVAVVGPHCEVAVHDFSDLEHSTVIVAGHVTGRRPGAPIPDLAFASEEIKGNPPDQINYHTRTGERTLQSSTIWLRDTAGKPVGAVCINVDYSAALQARDLVERLLTPTRNAAPLVVSNTFAKDMDELIELSVAEFLRQKSLSCVNEMNQEEKLRLIQLFEERGLFQIRGAVPRVAELLNVSRASIYNYRSNIAGPPANGAPTG